MRELKKHNFSKVFDLQNSSRTNFYKNILFPKADKIVWSSSITTLPSDKNKEEFDKISVLERFDYQLKESGLNTSNTLKPDFNWASTDISEIRNFYKLKKYILLFPFCSPHLTIKKWPQYNKLDGSTVEEFFFEVFIGEEILRRHKKTLGHGNRVIFVVFFIPFPCHQ